MLSSCCENKLNLVDAKLSDEYYYNSLPLCVIDAVFSIGINYNTTKKVVVNFCKKQNILRLREPRSRHACKENQLSINDFLNIYSKNSIVEITDNYFKNKCRTSTRNGILKSEAVKLFCEVLKNYQVNYFEDLEKIIGNTSFENDIQKIPGQKSGISTNYFYMLSGDDNFIKPDRMILRFVESCTGITTLKTDEATKLILEAHKKLVTKYPLLTPRGLDHEIWKYQKEKQ